jgi:hypothetical protein
MRLQRESAARGTGFADLSIAALVACAAAFLSMGWMVIGGFAGVPGNLEDGRLNAFLLEHSWGFLVQAPGQRHFWGLPAFFPAGDNALAFSDAMFSFGLLYWPWRAVGFLPDTSYQLWLLAVVAANVFACHLFFRFSLGSSNVAAAGCSCRWRRRRCWRSPRIDAMGGSPARSC